MPRERDLSVAEASPARPTDRPWAATPQTQASAKGGQRRVLAVLVRVAQQVHRVFVLRPAAVALSIGRRRAVQRRALVAVAVAGPIVGMAAIVTPVAAVAWAQDVLLALLAVALLPLYLAGAFLTPRRSARRRVQPVVPRVVLAAAVRRQTRPLLVGTAPALPHP